MSSSPVADWWKTWITVAIVKSEFCFCRVHRLHDVAFQVEVVDAERQPGPVAELVDLIEHHELLRQRVAARRARRARIAPSCTSAFISGRGSPV